MIREAVAYLVGQLATKLEDRGSNLSQDNVSELFCVHPELNGQLDPAKIKAARKAMANYLRMSYAKDLIQDLLLVPQYWNQAWDLLYFSFSLCNIVYDTMLLLVVVFSMISAILFLLCWMFNSKCCVVVNSRIPDLGQNI
ncbi:hypothetical protein PoB_003646100 [Plakobranchus ocellatus]|uniref:Uncharacterized protein n=1 Tax=Plakobranchus ocellatus TaxID=259542 RepID=A0AAV4AFK1_9GAST|nr:hypothetical protein PoB_003646100 [Plakobranchus ocellatus]